MDPLNHEPPGLGAPDPIPSNPLMARIIEAKERRRRELAALPIHEKVKILIQMQRMIVPIVRDRDPRARVWEIPGMEDENRH